MSQNYYKLYIESVVQLASTIVIKSDRSADTINERIQQLYGVVADPLDKTTWKYYLNLSGRYHPTDEVIEITSLDDLTKITFDRQTLLNHPATLEAYKFGTRYYRELITLYPEMQQFILGCLYPADISKAINSEDGTILAYPEYLVEENEESLIPNIEKWVKNFKSRWDNRQFNESDNLYCATNLGIMYLNLVPLILNLRLKACMTREVHSYHIRQFLASHGFLDKYLDFLNLKQRLFLYRNIRYIERNNGKISVFKWLVEKLLSDRGLPLAEYTMRHDTRSLTQTYYSEPSFRRNDLTNVYSQRTKSKPVLTLDELLKREQPLAPGNPEYILDTKDEIDKTFRNSLSSTVLTKVLESSVVDYTDSETYTLTEARLGHWLNNSANGLYNAVVTFKDPVSSADKTLSAFDAFIYYFYCYCYSLDIKLEEIPNLFIYKATRIENTTIDQLRNLVNTDYITDDQIQALLNTKVNQTITNSVTSFSELVKNVYNKYKEQRIILSSQEHFYKRGQLEAVSDSLYVSKEINTLDILEQRDGVRYSRFSEWLIAKGLSVAPMQTSTFELLYLEIFKNATGGQFYTTTQLSDLQKAMTKLLLQLSSYSIQILNEINTANIRKLGWQSIRLGDLEHLAKARHEILAINTYVNSSKTQELASYNVPVMPQGIKPTSTIQAVAEERIEIDTKVRPSVTDVIKNYVIRLGTMVINHSFVNPTAPGSIKALPTYQTFDSLTEEQKLSIKDVYHTVFETDTTIGKINTAFVLLNNFLPGFNAFTVSKPKLNSFSYSFVPYETINRVRIALKSELSALLPNLGKLDINAYSLFVSTTVGDMFKLFSGDNQGNGFKYFAGNISAHASYIHEKLEFGPQLSAFIWNGDSKTVEAYIYNHDIRDLTDINFQSENEDLNFITDFLGKAQVNHPTQPGSLFDGFYLVNQGGGSEYQIVGFTYNGTQIIWS